MKIETEVIAKFIIWLMRTYKIPTGNCVGKSTPRLFKRLVSHKGIKLCGMFALMLLPPNTTLLLTN